MYNDDLANITVMKADDGCEYQLSYYIRIFSSETDGQSYALRVDKLEQPGGRILESCGTPAFTDDLETIKRMADAFAEGQVPPCVLIEMCDEWL
jgi:hypothetical protein